MENLLTYMIFIPVAGAAIVLVLPNNAKLIRWVSAAATVPKPDEARETRDGGGKP